MHRKRTKGKSIDKMRAPYVYDPEQPDVKLGATEDLEHADHNLFTNDLSLIEIGSKSVSEIPGVNSEAVSIPTQISMMEE